MFRTATALATLLMVSTPALAQEDWTEFYAKIYGGWTPPGTHWYDNLPAEPLRHGYLFGAALGVGVPGLDWLSVELDATVSSARYDGAFDNYPRRRDSPASASTSPRTSRCSAKCAIRPPSAG